MSFMLKALYLKPINFVVVIFLILTLINEVLSLEEESKDKYYIITFQFNRENEEEIEDSNESNNELTFVNNQMKNILELIIDNKDTFENEELLKEYSDIKEKRNGNGDYLEEIVKLINENSSSIINILYENKEQNIYTIHALLSNELYLIIKDMPYVIECIEDYKIDDTDPIVQINDSPTDGIEEDEELDDTIIDDYYNLSSIKNETKWDDIEIDRNAYHHLSLLSQGKFDNSLINEYDSNYYYPRSAGKGVNIVIIDSGFTFEHKDFNTDNRIARCQAICVGRSCVETYKDPILSKFCIIESKKHLYPKHGTKVASTAAGNIYGVAKNANIFGITVDMATSSFASAIKYVINHSNSFFPPNKTIINISSGSYTKYIFYENILKEAEEKGYMIITSGGNDNIDGCIKNKREYVRDGKTLIAEDLHYPSSYGSTIGVGGINNNYSGLTLNVNYSVLYSKASFSNYGDCIDLWAPGYIYAALPEIEEVEILDKPNYCKTLKNKRDYEITDQERIINMLCKDKNNMFRKIKEISSTKKWGWGTSYSSPIVSGLSAVIISENPEIKFNQSILRKMLEELSLKNIINFNNITKHSRNLFINNGKRIIYSKDNSYPKNHCGPNVGNSICPNNGCCSKDGLCGTSDSFCEIKNGCQSEFGYCNNNNIIPQTQNTTTSILETTQKEIVKPTTTILETTQKEIVKPTTTILETTQKEIVKPTTTILETTQKEIVKPTTTILETTQKEIVKPTTTILETTQKEIVKPTTTILETIQKEIVKPTTTILETTQKEIVKPTTTILETPQKSIVKSTTTILKTTQKAIVKSTTTILKTTQKAIVKPTTTILKTTQKAIVKPTTTKNVTPTLPPSIFIITMYNTNYYVGKEKAKIPYDLNISKSKIKLYSNIKKAKVWGEIKNSSGYCLGNINKNYINKNKIKESSVKKDYLVFMPCNDNNVLSFYQYEIKTGDTIVKIGYRSNNKPFKGYYESSNHYRCRGKDGDNCCLYLSNDSIVAARCDGYYDDIEERKYYSFKVL